MTWVALELSGWLAGVGWDACWNNCYPTLSGMGIDEGNNMKIITTIRETLQTDLLLYSLSNSILLSLPLIAQPCTGPACPPRV